MLLTAHLSTQIGSINIDFILLRIGTTTADFEPLQFAGSAVVRIDGDVNIMDGGREDMSIE